MTKRERHEELAKKETERRIAGLQKELDLLKVYGVSCCGECHGEGYDNYCCSCRREWDCNTT